VTLLGQGERGVDVNLHLLAPDSFSLYHRAWISSGSVFSHQAVSSFFLLGTLGHSPKTKAVGAVGNRYYAKNSFSQRVLSMTMTYTQDFCTWAQGFSHRSIPLSGDNQLERSKENHHASYLFCVRLILNYTTWQIFVRKLTLNWNVFELHNHCFLIFLFEMI